MNSHTTNVNDPDKPSPICPTDGVLQDDQWKQQGEYYESSEGPFPVYACLICGSLDVEWD